MCNSHKAWFSRELISECVAAAKVIKQMITAWAWSFENTNCHEKNVKSKMIESVCFHMRLWEKSYEKKQTWANKYKIKGANEVTSSIHPSK